MKNALVVLGGFIFGMVGFLVLFKVTILDYTPPSDELAPGIVVLLSILNGLIFALIARKIQHRVEGKATRTETE